MGELVPLRRPDAAASADSSAPGTVDAELVQSVAPPPAWWASGVERVRAAAAPLVVYDPDQEDDWYEEWESPVGDEFAGALAREMAAFTVSCDAARGDTDRVVARNEMTSAEFAAAMAAWGVPRRAADYWCHVGAIEFNGELRRLELVGARAERARRSMAIARDGAAATLGEDR